LALHANNRKVWRNLRDLFPHPYTEADARQWIEMTQEESPPHNFAIAVRGHAVGGIGLNVGSDLRRRAAEIGYWLGEDFWGRGLATAAVRTFADYAFERFDVCRLDAYVLEWNPASRRVLEKAGFECEGRLRKSATKDGQTVDEFLYALVREEKR
jgi:RimJ/RimL family protein N-acetyltransferase